MEERGDRPWSVRTHLILIIGVAALAIAAATVYGYLWSAGQARSSAERSMKLEAQRAATRISSTIASARQSVSELAAQPGLDKAFTAAGQRACQLSADGSEALPSIRLDIVSAGGRVACSSVKSALGSSAPHGSPWLASALHAPGVAVDWTANDPVAHELSAVVSAPVKSGGRSVGVVVAFEHLPESGPALSANVGGARHPGFTLVDRNSRKVLATSVVGRRKLAGRRFGFVKVSGEGTALDGSRRVFGAADVPGSPVRVYAGLRESSVFAQARGALARQAIVALIALLILVAAGWLLYRRVAKPLQAFSRAVERAGLEGRDARVEEEGTAEIVTLARGFNSMLDLRAGHEAELIHQATHDPHTGLPNSILFRERLDEALRPSARGAGVAVLCLWVSRLDVVNEGFGRRTGDRVLAEVAGRLSRVLRPGDTLARSGGEEFVVLSRNVGEEGAHAMAERLHSCLAEPFRGPVSDIVLNGFVGFSLARGSTSADQLMREADSAMRQARRTGRHLHRFDTELQLRATEHLAVEHALWAALQEEQLRVYYQPLLDIESGRYVGAEALVRWRHPERGVMMPADFIPIAEETGQIAAIDRFVLSRACKQAATWAAAGHPLRMSVNVAAGQLADPEFHDFVARVLAETGLSPAQLCLEITESSLMRQAAHGAEHLSGLKRLGVALSIDDFGTGYSSLSYLHHLPVDELKIDRSFIAGLGRDRRDRHLVEAIVGMARALGLEVLAEGVETEQQLQALASLGCTRAQGYLFSRPQPPDRLVALLESRGRRAHAVMA
jgi:diguanylate cyclase (GGDEF)-like protein